jgi:hypothetical protein
VDMAFGSFSNGVSADGSDSGSVGYAMITAGLGGYYNIDLR